MPPPAVVFVLPTTALSVSVSRLPPGPWMILSPPRLAARDRHAADRGISVRVVGDTNVEHAVGECLHHHGRTRPGALDRVPIADVEVAARRAVVAHGTDVEAVGARWHDDRVRNADVEVRLLNGGAQRARSWCHPTRLAIRVVQVALGRVIGRGDGERQSVRGRRSRDDERGCEQETSGPGQPHQGTNTRPSSEFWSGARVTPLRARGSSCRPEA